MSITKLQYDTKDYLDNNRAVINGASVFFSQKHYAKRATQFPTVP